MQVHRTVIDGVLLFAPDSAVGFDAALALRHGVDAAALVRDPRSGPVGRGVVHGLHGTGGPTLVRCAAGALFCVVVDARPRSGTFGGIATVLLDETEHRRVHIPPGCLLGVQAVGSAAEARYRTQRQPGPFAGVTVRVDDPDLAVRWPLPVGSGGAVGSGGSAIRWADLCGRLGVEVPERTSAVGW